MMILGILVTIAGCASFWAQIGTLSQNALVVAIGAALTLAGLTDPNTWGQERK